MLYKDIPVRPGQALRAPEKWGSKNISDIPHIKV
jgi:hypothetical protein